MPLKNSRSSRTSGYSTSLTVPARRSGRKKWKKEAIECSKCGLDRASATHVFSEEIAQYAPEALKIVPKKGKITVCRFGRKLKLKRDKAGALAAALTNIGELQTKNVTRFEIGVVFLFSAL